MFPKDVYREEQEVFTTIYGHEICPVNNSNNKHSYEETSQKKKQI